MKVLMLNGSPAVHGCTYTALSEVTKTLNENGVETEIIHVGHLQIRGCLNCGKCSELRKCVFDDIVNEVAAKLADADGLVIGSPVYYASANGTLSALLDRLFFSNRTDLSMKVGACVVSARRGGCSSTFDQLNKYFTISGMPVAPSQYWNSVHGFTPDDVRKDAEGLQVMRALGRNMAFLIKSIALGREQFGIPQKEPRLWTHFIND